MAHLQHRAWLQRRVRLLVALGGVCVYSRVATASTPSSPNATSAALQQKLDGGDVVTVGPDPVGQAAWLVGQPLLFQRSHQRVVFLPGTLIWAANDTFHGRSDSLFTIGAHPQRLAPGVPGPPSLTNLSIVGYGAVWRMRRKDYAKTSADKSNGWYSVSEYRNGLTVQGCSDVTIEGITIQETGGDGIYVNTVWNVTLRRVLVDGAYRNGVSVIAADGLLVEHSILRNTRGTDPEAGVDIEPNACVPGRCKHVNFIHGVQFTNTSFDNNFGGGILVSLGENLGNATMPIGVRFDDCRVNGTGFFSPLATEADCPHHGVAIAAAAAARLRTTGATPNAVVISGAGPPYVNSGEVHLQNLSIANASGGVGLVLNSIPDRGWATVTLDHLRMEDVGFCDRVPAYLSPISIFGRNPYGLPASPADDGRPTGSIKILHATIHDRSARPYLRMVGAHGFHGVDVSGTVNNPYGCVVAVEAGFPLRDVVASRIPASNLSVDMMCNTSMMVDGGATAVGVV